MIVSHAVVLGKSDAKLRRVANGYGPDDIARFEAVANAVFAETQAAVHVITGRLKRSGNLDTDTTGKKWRATISYGDELDVHYAGYELARGDTHDFLAPARESKAAFVQAMKDYLRGET